MIMTRAQARTVKRAADTLGVPLPATFTSQLDATTALVNAAHNIGESTAQLNTAVLDALAAGRDYHTDPTVTGLLLDAVLVRVANIGEAARGRAEHELAAALAEHADTILAGWADALDPHAQALAAAAAELPANLHDTKAIVNRGATAMHQWAAAQQALKCWTAAVDGFASLASASRITADRHNPAILTPASLNILEPVQVTARSTGTHPDAWTLARHGIPLRLATLGEFMQRTTMLEQQRAQAAALAERRRLDERRRAQV